MAEELGLSKREVERVGVIAEVVAGRMRQRRAAELLAVTVRQIKRLVRSYRAQGATGLRSRRRGCLSNRRHSDVVRARVLALAATRYADFGPTLLAEYLAREQAVVLAPETLRQWLITAGLFKAKARKCCVHRARSRRPRFGELVQIDGSPHDWFEGRAPRCTMLVFIDDATSRVVYARFVDAETTQAYLDGFLAHLSAHGAPLAYYSDRHSIFRVNRDDTRAPPTQVERAPTMLGIASICAHSPQAKGRVERVHQTFQDRLVKALRLAQIQDIDAANAFLADYLIPHNARFAKPAIDPQDAHRALSVGPVELARILSPQHARVVNRQGVVQFHRHAYQLKQPRRCIGKTLTVVQTRQGIELLLDQRALAHSVFDLKHWRTEVTDRKVLDARLDRQPRNHPTPKPKPEHPWNRSRSATPSRAFRRSVLDSLSNP